MRKELTTDNSKAGRKVEALVSTLPEIHHRPWGYYEILAHGPGYLVKRITVDPGKRTSLQWHKLRDEDWVFVDGTDCEITESDSYGTEYITNNPYSVFIIKGELHRISNTGTKPLVIIEIQTSDEPDGCREDDIHRIEDDYDREVECRNSSLKEQMDTYDPTW